jgi:hypothetical protein
MAIDSKEKRASVTGIHLYVAGPGVTPTAAQDQEWRQEVGYGYPGIAAAAPIPGTIGLLKLLGVGR